MRDRTAPRSPRGIEIDSADIPKHHVFRPLSRGGLHLTLLERVSAAGDPVTPTVIASNRISDDASSHWLHRDEDVMSRVRQPMWSDSALLCEYMSMDFLPHVRAVGGKLQLEREKAVL
jgi:hypothetical protein